MHLSDYLLQTSNGQEIRITNHRRIVARLHGVACTGNPSIQALLAKDAAWSGCKPAGTNLVASNTTQTLSDLILEMRG